MSSSLIVDQTTDPHVFCFSWVFYFFFTNDQMVQSGVKSKYLHIPELHCQNECFQVHQLADFIQREKMLFSRQFYYTVISINVIFKSRLQLNNANEGFSFLWLNIRYLDRKPILPGVFNLKKNLIYFSH